MTQTPISAPVEARTCTWGLPRELSAGVHSGVCQQCSLRIDCADVPNTAHLQEELITCRGPSLSNDEYSGCTGKSGTKSGTKLFSTCNPPPWKSYENNPRSLHTMGVCSARNWVGAFPVLYGRPLIGPLGRNWKDDHGASLGTGNQRPTFQTGGIHP